MALLVASEASPVGSHLVERGGGAASGKGNPPVRVGHEGQGGLFCLSHGPG